MMIYINRRIATGLKSNKSALCKGFNDDGEETKKHQLEYRNYDLHYVQRLSSALIPSLKRRLLENE